ncbi:MAG: hypothetical protein JNL70_26575 [Saprospiraceae bacterium]|nr:hypothetical protein [Saprospiraceae bacterium]
MYQYNISGNGTQLRQQLETLRQDFDKKIREAENNLLILEELLFKVELDLHLEKMVVRDDDEIKKDEIDARVRANDAERRKNLGLPPR